MKLRFRLLPVLLAACLAMPAVSQSFDNFGDGSLDGFELGTDGVDAIDTPSLSQDGGLGIGPDIQLQESTSNDDTGIITVPGSGRPVTSVSQPETEAATRATLRALDKTLGRPTDIDLAAGETVIFGRIAIRLLDCRYPVGDPTSDAFAQLEVYDLEGNSLFSGWMVASSPALNALEHPRYDVWVLRCYAP